VRRAERAQKQQEEISARARKRNENLRKRRDGKGKSVRAGATWPSHVRCTHSELAERQSGGEAQEPAWI
jgi:hypothetical protein